MKSIYGAVRTRSSNIIIRNGYLMIGYTCVLQYVLTQNDNFVGLGKNNVFNMFGRVEKYRIDNDEFIDYFDVVPEILQTGDKIPETLFRPGQSTFKQFYPLINGHKFIQETYYETFSSNHKVCIDIKTNKFGYLKFNEDDIFNIENTYTVNNINDVIGMSEDLLGDVLVQNGTLLYKIYNRDAIDNYTLDSYDQLNVNNSGGGVYGSISSDDTNIYFGTGNPSLWTADKLCYVNEIIKEYSDKNNLVIKKEWMENDIDKRIYGQFVGIKPETYDIPVNSYATAVSFYQYACFNYEGEFRLNKITKNDFSIAQKHWFNIVKILNEGSYCPRDNRTFTGGAIIGLNIETFELKLEYKPFKHDVYDWSSSFSPPPEGSSLTYVYDLGYGLNNDSVNGIIITNNYFLVVTKSRTLSINKNTAFNNLKHVNGENDLQFKKGILINSTKELWHNNQSATGYTEFSGNAITTNEKILIRSNSNYNCIIPELDNFELPGLLQSYITGMEIETGKILWRNLIEYGDTTCTQPILQLYNDILIYGNNTNKLFFVNPLNGEKYYELTLQAGACHNWLVVDDSIYINPTTSRWGDVTKSRVSTKEYIKWNSVAKLDDDGTFVDEENNTYSVFNPPATNSFIKISLDMNSVKI